MKTLLHEEEITLTNYGDVHSFPTRIWHERRFDNRSRALNGFVTSSAAVTEKLSSCQKKQESTNSNLSRVHHKFRANINILKNISHNTNTHLTLTSFFGRQRLSSFSLSHSSVVHCHRLVCTCDDVGRSSDATWRDLQIKFHKLKAENSNQTTNERNVCAVLFFVFLVFTWFFFYYTLTTDPVWLTMRGAIGGVNKY